MGRYVKVPYCLLDLKENNAVKYTLIALLYFKSSNSNKITVTLAKLSKVARLNSRQLTNHINTLIKHGLISRKQKIVNGEYGSNVYTLLYEDKYSARIPWDIAYNERLSISAIIAYCVMKQNINLNNKKFTFYGIKEDLAQKFQCSLNQVDKIKRSLKEAGLIEWERHSKKIILVYELNMFQENKTTSYLLEVKLT